MFTISEIHVNHIHEFKKLWPSNHPLCGHFIWYKYLNCRSWQTGFLSHPFTTIVERLLENFIILSYFIFWSSEQVLRMPWQHRSPVSYLSYAKVVAPGWHKLHLLNLNQSKTNCSKNLNSDGMIVREMGPWPECIFRSLLQFLLSFPFLPFEFRLIHGYCVIGT